MKSQNDKFNKVLVFGTFDILHPGHVRFLQQAKKLGNYLIVSIARSVNVKRIKGRAPLHSDLDRKKLLESLKFVDQVVLGARDDHLAHIISIEPQIIVLGYDQIAYTKDLKKMLQKRGLLVKVVRLKSYKPKIYKSRKLWRNFSK